MNEEKMNKLLQKYEERTAELSREKAMEMLAEGDTDDFLMLVQIADNCEFGKSKAILIAFRLGYLRGKEELADKISRHFDLK